MVPLPDAVINGALREHRHVHRSQSEPEHVFLGSDGVQNGPIPHRHHEHQHHSKSYQLGRRQAVEQKEDSSDPVMDRLVDSMIANEQNGHQMMGGGLEALQQIEADIVITEREYNLNLNILLNELIMPIFR